MEEVTMERRQKYAYLVSMFVAFAVIIAAHFCYNGYESQNEEILSYESGWTYYNGESFEYIDKMPDNIEWQSDKELILRNILPENEKQYYNTILFRSSNQSVKVYVENTLIYKLGVDDERLFGKTPGSNWNYVIIPEGSAGKQIEIRLNSPYEDCAGFISDFKLGTYEKLQRSFLNERMPQISVSIAILIYGVVLVAVYLLLAKHTKNAGGYAYLGFFGIFIAIWSLLETQVIQFIYSNTAVLTLVTFYSLMLIPVALNQFVARMYLEAKDKLKSILNCVCYLNIIIQTILQLANIADVYQMVFVTHTIIAISWITAAIRVFIKYIKTRESIYKRVTVAFIVLLLSGLIDLLRYYMGDFGDYAKFFRVGILIFITLLSVWYTGGVFELLKKGISANVYEKMAYEDALTKCKNRAYFAAELKKINEYHKKFKKMGIVTFDVNDLKVVNDTYGHASGDELLCKAAYCISSAFKGLGEIARIGGDEFAVILKNADIEAIESAISVMCEKAQYYSMNNENGILLTIAYGYSIYDEMVDKDMEAVMVRADRKMYAKKKEMKSKVKNM